MQGMGEVSILAGFEIPTGARVEIPDTGHLAWFGQTQLSGKTTALEAFVWRSDVKAVAFITKRGEGSFLTGRKIAPFFSEPTNDPEQPLWRWVKSILEASQSRKLNFEESWIISACEKPRSAKTLADVHQNITALLEGEGEHIIKRGKKKREWKWHRKPVSGMNAGIYTSLKAYFDIVMPQLARLPYTKKLDLKPGLNVMDLRDYSIETQGLVIRSVMEYVYQHETNCRVIVPEAQDFVPQTRNTPVKMACETLVRKGAADRNFMWLDSQDMAAVDKVMLRAVSIMGCGVQGELNELGRTIGTLFGTKVTPRDIGALHIGEFFIRVPGGDVKKVYIQPAWMDSETHAQAIARGEVPVSSAKTMLKAFTEERAEENEQSQSKKEAADLPVPQRRAANDECAGNDVQHGPESSANDPVLRIHPDVANEGSEEFMWQEKYETLKSEFDLLVSSHDSMAKRLEILLARTGSAGGSPREGNAPAVVDGPEGSPSAKNGHAQQFENVYDYVVSRARKDPGVLQILAEKPELRVKFERVTVQIDGSTLRGALARMISTGFFKEPKNGNTAFNEITRLGRPTAKPNVYRELKELAAMGFLTNEESGFREVSGMKIHIEGA